MALNDRMFAPPARPARPSSRRITATRAPPRDQRRARRVRVNGFVRDSWVLPCFLFVSTPRPMWKRLGRDRRTARRS